MNNVLLKLAFKNLKDHKKRTAYLIIIITFISCIIIGLTTYTRLISHQQLINNVNQYGGYCFAIDHADESQIGTLKKNPFITQKIATYQYGTLTNLNIGYLDNDISLLPISVKAGNLPKEANEVAIEEEFLVQLGYSLDIGQIIHLSYTLNDGNTIQETFILSGILNNYSSSMLTSSLQVVTTQKIFPVTTNIYYLTDNLTPAVDGDNTIRNEYVFPRLVDEAFYKQLGLQTTIFLIIIIGGLMIMNAFNGITQSLVSKIVLLRGVGATRKQVMAMMLLQSFIFTLIAIPISIILSFIGIFSVSQVMGYIFYFDLEACGSSLISIVITILLGSSYPAIKAANVSLAIRSDSTKSRIKVRHKHFLTPLRLTFRHLRINKSKNIILILIIAITLVYLENNVSRYNDNVSSLQGSGAKNPGSFLIDSREGNISDGYVASLLELYGIEKISFREEVNSGIEMDYQDAYFTTTNINHNAYFSITILHTITDEQLDSLNVDKQSFLAGDSVIMYLPKMYLDPRSGGLSSVNNESETKQIVQDTNMVEGQSFTIQNKTFIVQKIIASDEDDQILREIIVRDMYTYLHPYTIFVSPAFMEGLDLKIDWQKILIVIKENVSNQGFYSRLAMFNSQFEGNRNITNFQEINDKMITRIKNERTNNVLYGIIGVVGLILIMSQQASSRVSSRKREIGIYHALGMENNKIYRIFIYEGLLLGGFSIILALSIIIFADYNSHYEYLKNYTLAYTFTSDKIPMYSILFMGTLIIFVCIYYFSARKFIKQKMIDNISFKE